jgi:hypothetical protein
MVLFTVCKISAQEKGFIPYKLDKKWVVLNDSCQIISKEKYDTVCLMSGGVARVKQKGKWGYINRNCSTVVTCKYDEISGFDATGYARVRNKKKWGYVNRKNELMIPMIYDTIALFNPYDNYAQGKIRDSIFFVDRKGNRNTGLFHPAVCGGSIISSINFMAQIIKNKKGLYGLYSQGRAEGNDTIVPCEYKTIESIYASIFAILIKDKYSLYNTVKQKMVIVDCDTISFYYERREEYWVLYRKMGITGFINPYGDQQTEIDYKSIKIITSDFIYITDNNNKSYYINYKGKKYIPKMN